LEKERGLMIRRPKNGKLVLERREGGGKHEDVGMKRIKRGRNDLETKMDTK